MINYSGLEEKLKEKGIRKSDLTRELGISSRTIAKIGRREKLSVKVMEKIADYLGCAPGDLTALSDIPSNPTVSANSRTRPEGERTERTAVSRVAKS